MTNDIKKPTVNVFSLNKDLQEFKEEVRSNTNKILEILENKQEPAIAEMEVKDVNEEENTLIVEPIKEDNRLPAKYQEIFDDIFDPADGFIGELNMDNNIEFAIIVPKKFSNATDAYSAFYKIDRRLVVLQQGNIEGGIMEWCEKVANNLHYDKNAVRK